MQFTDDQITRYSRHILLPEVGGKGQKKIAESRILIVGAGGLGSPAALYLAAAGVGTLGLIDHDVVDLSNLQRQVLHHTPDLGRSKVLSAKEKIEALNPDVRVVLHEELEEATQKILSRLFDCSPTAARFTKNLLNRSFHIDPRAHVEDALAAQRQCLASPELSEANRAWTEPRDTRFFP
jgi:enoyl-CoA hydratase/carnithine racemase